MLDKKKIKYTDLIPNNTVEMARPGEQKPMFSQVVGGGNVAPAMPQAQYGYSDAIKEGSLMQMSRVPEVVPPTFNAGGGVDESKDVSEDVTPKKPTYEEWIATQKNNAATSRDSAISDAQTMYQRSKSEYGNKAEALRNMGLTGSGYSDYLNGQAYAQMQGAIANANAQKASTIADIDARYMDYLEQKNAAAQSAYMSMYGNLVNDYNAYSVKDIERLGAEANLSESQIENLKNAKAERLIASGTYSKSDLIDLFGEGTEEYNKYLKQMQDEANLLDRKAFYNSEGSLIDKSEANALIKELENIGADTSKLKAEFSALYEPKIANIVFNKDGGKDKPGVAGNNFSVKLADNNRVVFRVQYTGAEVSEEAKAAGSTFDEGTVFKYDGNLYVKRNGEIYAIGARPMNETSYRALMTYFDDTKNDA